LSTPETKKVCASQSRITRSSIGHSPRWPRRIAGGDPAHRPRQHALFERLPLELGASQWLTSWLAPLVACDRLPYRCALAHEWYLHLKMQRLWFS
jgi:hypothetical protein